MTKKEIANFASTRVNIRKGAMILALIGLVILSVAGCTRSATLVPPVESEYIGRVIDVGNQQPIMGAKVTLDVQGNPPIVYTDAEGVYHFYLVINSNISGQVKVEAQGYQIYTRNISILLDNKRIEDIRLTRLPPTSTPQQLPVSTFTLEPTSTFTLTPTSVAASTPQVKTFAEGCISSKTWTPHSPDGSMLNSIFAMSDGCYDMGPVGIFADGSGVLHILDKNKRDHVSYGIAAPINNDSVIEFKVFVDSMYLLEEGNPLYASFAVASASDPASEKNTARFKLQVEQTNIKPVIIFVLADAGENNGAAVGGRHYGYGNTYAIRLELTGNVMSVYINDVKMHEMLSLPVGSRVFRIGYNLPAFASIDINVMDVKIDGVLK